MPDWLILSRTDCSLCETMASELLSLLGDRGGRVRALDIAGDEELERQYGTRIPVLLADGEFVCAYRLDAERVKRYMSVK